MGSLAHVSPVVDTRRLADIGAEAVLIAGGGRAILLQLANPAIGHAIARHSDFVADPLKRLRHTLTFVYALVYGTPTQTRRVREFVDAAHAPVRSPLGETPGYDARDARLQLWVAATLYDTAVMVRERLVGPLSEAELDAVYEDYAIVGTSLQVEPGMWPRDRAAFAEYWSAAIAELSVDDTVLAVGRSLLHPPSVPLWLRVSMPLARLVTAGLLPAAVREAFRLPWDARRARRFERAMTIMAAVNRMLPRAIREWPKRHLLARL